jgi:hypothetical protein
VQLQNTIVADNSAHFLGADRTGSVASLFVSLGNNLIGDSTGCTISVQFSDLTGDPGLDIFSDHGRPGSGHIPLLSGSPAIDAGNNEACPRTDQLGQTRAGNWDIGAIEFQPAVTVLAVAVDIRPGNPHNNINPNSNALIPVAMLGANGFDASTVDQATARFGPQSGSSG